MSALCLSQEVSPAVHVPSGIHPLLAYFHPAVTLTYVSEPITDDYVNEANGRSSRAFCVTLHADGIVWPQSSTLPNAWILLVGVFKRDTGRVRDCPTTVATYNNVTIFT
jgi:hypothetical protein